MRFAEFGGLGKAGAGIFHVFMSRWVLPARMLQYFESRAAARLKLRSMLEADIAIRTDDSCCLFYARCF